MKAPNATAAWMVAGAICLMEPAAPAEAQATSSTHAAALLYRQARFGAELEPWHLLTGEVQHRSTGFDSVLRISTARRFGLRGHQLEVETYRRFGREGYVALGAAYSPDAIFPTWRIAAELYRNVGAAFELSAGAQYMEFDSANLRLVTTSLGRYVPRWYLSARSTVVPRDGEILLAGGLLLRRYISDGADHVTLRMDLGETPAENVREVEHARQRSLRAGLDGRSRLRGPWELLWSTAWEREWFPSGWRRTRLEGGLGLTYEF